MANCLKVIVNNEANNVVFGDCYGKNNTYDISKEGLADFLQNKANHIYNAHYADCDSVSLYNNELYICAIEDEIDFTSISFGDYIKLVDKELGQ